MLKFVNHNYLLPQARKLAAPALITFAIAACGPQPEAVDVSSMLDRAGEDAGVYAQAGPAASGSASSLRLLPNDTSLPGENFVRTIPHGFFGPASLDATLRRAGPLPAPFDFALAEDFRTSGSLHWLERFEGDVTCVLAVRTAGSIAGNPASVLMRNCVKGDTSAALAPLASLSAS